VPASKAAIARADKRAREAARLARLGHKPKEIAIRLGLRSHDIGKYLRRAEKLGS
jgi:DNA-binding CsgD family transcriptional regulator